MAKRTACAGPIPYRPEPTFAEVRQAFIKRVFDEGKIETCPCCNQTAKVYKRQVYDTIAVGLIRMVYLYRKSGKWVHRRDLGADLLRDSGGDISKLEWWGLTERKPKTPGENSSGFMRPTELGIAFVEGRVRIAAYVLAYNKRPIFFSPETIDIRTALGKDFDYAEVMANPFA